MTEKSQPPKKVKWSFPNPPLLNSWLVGLWYLTQLSVISWQSVLLVEETPVPGKNH